MPRLREYAWVLSTKIMLALMSLVTSVSWRSRRESLYIVPYTVELDLHQRREGETRIDLQLHPAILKCNKVALAILY